MTQGGGEYGRGRGIGGIPRPADRSFYSSIFSVCGISISSLLGCYFVRLLFFGGEVYVYCFSRAGPPFFFSLCVSVCGTS